ncbi:hypothetical protein KFL_003900090 [Klebsormidium nitens]|uniref:Sfi1 spindle body domain-containing protein n=1 Tax=Klebsormidium nitens TaxID=105231 RepID=A0A1Y1IEU9_KLENI|nr:hypothetical protein KFL_003900090 [Klebsormidium nitens]|eukprot:GAQ87969.1 hypothetical protein KFL_003900090 [Klebsormidium nitens]
MDVYEKASAVLRDWEGDNEPSLLPNLEYRLDLEDTAWTYSLLNSYVNKGQLPPQQLLSTEPEHKSKRYDPAQYVETLQPRGLERQTKASVAKYGQARAQEAKPGHNVKEYAPRLVMELRHQMVEEKRKKRAPQKVDILAQGRAALAEARGVQLAPHKSTVSSGTPGSTKPERKDNRVVAYQKRKLAVQEEQQRLEAEVQRLREQIRADAEAHRRARRDGAHAVENADSASTELDSSTGCASAAAARDDVSGSHDVSRSRSRSAAARGALTEIRNSNGQDKQGPQRPRSAGRIPTKQREGNQDTGEGNGESFRVKASGHERNAAGNRAERRDRGSIKSSGSRGSSNMKLELSPTRQSAFAAPGEGQDRELHSEDSEGDSLGMTRDEGGSIGQAARFSAIEESSTQRGQESTLAVPESGEEAGNAAPSITEVQSTPADSHPAQLSRFPGENSSEGTRGAPPETANGSAEATDPLTRVRSLEGNGVLPDDRQMDPSNPVNQYTAEPGASRSDADAQAKDDPASSAVGERAEREAGSMKTMEAASVVAQQAESMARKRLALEEAAATALAAQQLEAAEALRDKELKTTLELLLATKDKRALRLAWSTWRAVAVSARAPLQRAMIVLQWRRMTLFWRAWREEVQKGKDDRAKELLEAELRAEASKRQRAVHHWRLRLLSQAFILWQDFGSKERLKKEVQAQHAARSHKMRALLSKQDALRLSLLWKDRKYRAGEVDAPGTVPPELRPTEATGGSDRCEYAAPTGLLRPGVVSTESVVVYREGSDAGEGPFPVHLTEYADVVEGNERAFHTGRDEAKGLGAKGHDRAGANGMRAAETAPAVQTGLVRGTESALAEAVESEAARSDTPSFESSLRAPARARVRAEDKETSDTRQPFSAPTPSNRHTDEDDRMELTEGGWISAQAPPESLGRGSDIGARGADARDGDDLLVNVNGDPVEKMEERAAARRRRREELKRKYEEAQKRKEEEHAAAERLRLEAERLERAAALARKVEDARAKKEAEEAALKRKELAAQQMVLAKLHCKRQVMLRLGWRPWREVIVVARTRFLSSVAHHQRSLQRATWHAWRAHLEAARDEREREECARLETARDHWRTRTSARAFAWWRLVRTARKQGDRSSMARAVRCLQEAVAAGRERCEAAAAWRARSLQARAWRGWRARAEEGRDVRLLKEVADAALADRFAHRSLLSRSFFDWSEAVEDAKVATEKERQEEAMWAKINGWLADHRKGKESSSTQGALNLGADKES